MGVMIAAWLGVIGVCLGAVVRYERTPGAVGRAPAAFMLTVFVHPECPCTRATVQEVGEIQRGTGGRVSVEYVVVPVPGIEAAELPEGREGAVWRHALDGREAEVAGAKTSGHVVLRDAVGRVVFSGGVTGGRGWWGRTRERRRWWAGS